MRYYNIGALPHALRSNTTITKTRRWYQRETETEATVGAKQNVVRVKESNLYKENKMKNTRNSTSLSRREKRKTPARVRKMDKKDK